MKRSPVYLVLEQVMRLYFCRCAFGSFLAQAAVSLVPSNEDTDITRTQGGREKGSFQWEMEPFSMLQKLFSLSLHPNL